MTVRNDDSPRRQSDHETAPPPDPPPRERANSKQRYTRIELDKIDRADRRFLVRDPKGLTEEGLKDLIASIRSRGVQVPIEYVRDGTRGILVAGERRVAACLFLARKGVPGFSDQMAIPALELLETDPRELLLRGVTDNCLRKNLDQVERVRAAHTLFVTGVPDARAAEALGVSGQSYKRDLIIAQSPWMMDHLDLGNINPTSAFVILRAILEAESEHPEIRTQAQADVDAWIWAKRQDIDRRDKVLKAKRGRGKGLSEADKQVRRYLTNQLAEHWAELIRQGHALDDEVGWTYPALLDLDKDVLMLGSARLNLAKDPVRKLAEVASKLSQLAQDLKPVIQARHEQEQRRGRPAGRSVIRDTSYLREIGLADFADECEQELRALAEAGPDGEKDWAVDRHAPRTERELAAEVDVPDDQPDGDAAGHDDPSGGEEVAR
jgi:hypothetical protein